MALHADAVTSSMSGNGSGSRVDECRFGGKGMSFVFLFRLHQKDDGPDFASFPLIRIEMIE